jgi:hypothetical protein
MSLRALDAALVRLAAARSGAVSSVRAVSRADAVRAVDPARGTDPRWLEIPRPDPAAIPPADIARFQALVHGPDPVFGTASPSAAHAPRAWAGEGAAGPAPAAPESLEGPLPPAERVVITLRHLRSVNGL